MNNSRSLWPLLIAATASLIVACADFREEIMYRTSDLGSYDDAGSKMGLELDAVQYKSALSRWPWIEGSQLRRRALILSLKPSDEQLALLDKSKSSADELSILNQLQTLRVAHQNPNQY